MSNLDHMTGEGVEHGGGQQLLDFGGGAHVQLAEDDPATGALRTIAAHQPRR